MHSLTLLLFLFKNEICERQITVIADGGNVAVEGVDAEAGAVFLKLEGACGEFSPLKHPAAFSCESGLTVVCNA